jgi:hypothetical protein
MLKVNYKKWVRPTPCIADVFTIMYFRRLQTLNARRSLHACVIGRKPCLYILLYVNAWLSHLSHSNTHYRIAVDFIWGIPTEAYTEKMD